MSQITPSEAGLTPSPLPAPGNLPPNDGKWDVSHFMEFSAIVNMAARNYMWAFDEALRSGKCNALAMRRDAVIFGALRARQMPTAALTFHIDPDDETDAEQVDASKEIQKIIERMPRFQSFKICLLEAVWYGRSACQILYKWDTHKGREWLVPKDWTPVNGDSLMFKWDGTPGILVHSFYPGRKESAGAPGQVHFFDPREREIYCIHMHEPEGADFSEASFAGRRFGVGLRDRLYWIWWLKVQVFALMTNYLERFSNGLTIFYYDPSNVNAKQEAIEAAQQQFSKVAMIYPKFADANVNYNGVQRLEVGTASPSLLQNLVDGYFDRIIEKTILGQELTHTTAPTGLGSGVAAEHGKTFDQIIQYDATNLEDTLQTDLVDVLYRWNYPHMRPGRFVFEKDTPNVAEVIANAQALYQMGLAIDEDSLREVTKLPAPKGGSQVVTKMGSLQPAAVGQVPAGVPSVGPAGPEGMSPDMSGVPNVQGQATPPPAQ